METRTQLKTNLSRKIDACMSISSLFVVNVAHTPLPPYKRLSLENHTNSTLKVVSR